MADLEDLERAGPEAVVLGIEEAAEGAGERVMVKALGPSSSLEGKTMMSQAPASRALQLQ